MEMSLAEALLAAGATVMAINFNADMLTETMMELDELVNNASVMDDFGPMGYIEIEYWGCIIMADLMRTNL